MNVTAPDICHSLNTQEIKMFCSRMLLFKAVKRRRRFEAVKLKQAMIFIDRVAWPQSVTWWSNN